MTRGQLSPVSAHRTAEWLLARVDHDVVQEGLARGELLVADRADQQLVPGVDPLVLLHVPLPLELLLTAFKCNESRLKKRQLITKLKLYLAQDNRSCWRC